MYQAVLLDTAENPRIPVWYGEGATPSYSPYANYIPEHNPIATPSTFEDARKSGVWRDAVPGNPLLQGIRSDALKKHPNTNYIKVFGTTSMWPAIVTKRVFGETPTDGMVPWSSTLGNDLPGASLTLSEQHDRLECNPQVLQFVQENLGGGTSSSGQGSDAGSSDDVHSSDLTGADGGSTDGATLGANCTVVDSPLTCCFTDQSTGMKTCSNVPGSSSNYSMSVPGVAPGSANQVLSQVCAILTSTVSCGGGTWSCNVQKLTANSVTAVGTCTVARTDCTSDETHTWTCSYVVQ